MSKIHLLALLVLISIHSFSQSEDLPRFDLENYELPKAIIIQTETINKAELKVNIQNWLDGYYSESELLKCQYSEDTFYITALAHQLLEVKNLTTDLKYQLNISLRDGKYKIEVTSLKYKYYTEYRTIANISLIQDEDIRRDLENSRSQISIFLNELNQALVKFILKDSEDW
ncbi:hypothetical protein G3567_07960 [Psychroflexus sp. YR1-1]|uniref:DUF4468 domain-containing protein n=1 Tax=Psychroflexus aurantiacus TaxID=2709310 RepID=A0A6B3R3G1_9FLAO|nr:DUF4468 domain-containing protein [Psychroflexus aurantiacus]NEV94080.1 hypothetical protein [Psychroflexus aurantiacus]